MYYISELIIVLGTIAFFFFLIQEFQEVNYLKKVLQQVISKKQIESVNDLTKLKNYLNNNISYDATLRTKKRPLLRHTASQILKMNYGFCGENARVAIKLFLLGKMNAARIYLYGEKWGHVVIEHQMNGEWYLFDGHYDPKTKLEDKYLASIQSKNIAQYPNGYPENNYIDFCRIKLFYILPAFKKMAKLRLPSFIIYYFESPYLIKATLASVFAFIGIFLYYLTQQ